MSTTKLPLAKIISDNLQLIRDQVRTLDSETLARQSGFLKRKPRKIQIPDLLLGLISLASHATLSLPFVVSQIALACGLTYTKQAFSKRLNSSIQSFLGLVAGKLLGDLVGEVRAQGLLKPFGRVLLHDSTVENVPEHLKKFFPGSSNRRKKFASLKIQLVVDMLNSSLVDCSLSGYTRNDQAAAPDILSVIRPGDLVLRDLGYFVLSVFQSIDLAGAYFLSRFRHGVGVFTLEGKPINLSQELKARGSIDQDVLLGAQRVRVRLVALPVPEAVVNQRRRQLKAAKDTRCKPSAQRVFLMGWNIFITNVGRRVWSAKALYPVYRLRWRIEMIFKAWKSHLGLREFNTTNVGLLSLSVMIKLLLCIMVYRFCQSLEFLKIGDRHVSLLKVAKIIAQCACLVVLALLDLKLEQFLEYQLKNHAFYEQRGDRQNYFELLESLG